MAAVLCAASRLVAADGTWVNTVGGNWADAGNWQDGTVAGGAGAVHLVEGAAGAAPGPLSTGGPALRHPDPAPPGARRRH